jgi:hypothetical protein
MLSYQCGFCRTKPYKTAKGLDQHQKRFCKAYIAKHQELFDSSPLRSPSPSHTASPSPLPERAEEESLLLLGNIPEATTTEGEAPQAHPAVDERALRPTRAGRARRRPKYFDDFVLPIRSRLRDILGLPEPPVQTDPITAPNIPLSLDSNLLPSEHDEIPDADLQRSLSPEPSDEVVTDPNEFGISRVYPQMPTHDPDRDDGPIDRVWISHEALPLASFSAVVPAPILTPFGSMSEFLLVEWYYRSPSKSLEDMDRLVHEVLNHPEFSAKELGGFTIRQVLQRIDALEVGDALDWHISSVQLPIPGRPEPEGSEPKFLVENLVHKSLTAVIRDFFTKPLDDVHLTPYAMQWTPPWTDDPEQIVQEMYNTPLFIEEHEQVRKLPQPADETYETVVAAIMVWSDSTHLASFGTASLWPIYGFFGNLSKYVRAKPTSFAAQHLAYIPTVSIITDLSPNAQF